MIRYEFGLKVFLFCSLSASKVDMRRYVDGGEDTLQCEIRRTNTGGIVMRWPGLGAQEHDIWFTCTLTHTQGQFVITTFLRHTPAQAGTEDLIQFADRELLTTSGKHGLPFVIEDVKVMIL